MLLWLALAVGGPAIAEAASPAEMISTYRQQHGEGQVTTDAALHRIAQAQASAMASKNLLDHDVLGPFNRRAASSGSERAAENIAYGYDSFAKTLNQWIESAGHRGNLLLHGASRVGVASAKSADGRTYWAMVIAGGYEHRETAAARTPKTPRAKTTGAKTTEAKTTEAKPTEAKTTEAKTTEVKPTEAKPTEAKPASAVKPRARAKQACRMKILGLCL